MPQTTAQVREAWERATGTHLTPTHRQRFDERDEAVTLASMPRMVMEQSAVDVVHQAGELRLTTWLERARVRWREVPPLIIELVPSTCWWSNLRSELPAEQWVSRPGFSGGSELTR